MRTGSSTTAGEICYKDSREEKQDGKKRKKGIMLQVAVVVEGGGMEGDSSKMGSSLETLESC